MIKVKKFIQEVIPGFEANSYLVKSNNKAILIDPGTVSEKLKQELKDVQLEAVLLTHAHFDHIMGLNYLNVPIYLTKEEMVVLKTPEYNYSSMYGLSLDLANKNIRNIEEYTTFDNVKVTTYNTPGHTGGSCCIKIENHLFTGDTLFVNTIGRTDLATSSTKEIYKSLEVFKKFSSDTIIYPGHGGKAKMKKVREINPFLNRK